MSTSKGNSQYGNTSKIGYGPEANIMPDIYASEMYGYGSGAPYYPEPDLGLYSKSTTPAVDYTGGPTGVGGNQAGGPFGTGYPGADGLGNIDPGGNNIGDKNKGPGGNGGPAGGTKSAVAPGSTAGPGGADAWLNPQFSQTVMSGSGPAFDQNAELSNDPAAVRQRQQYLQLESQGIPALERQYGSDPSHMSYGYNTNAQGLPSFDGYQYTGASHEIGGNPQLAQFAIDNGLSPEQFADFLIQGSNAQRAYSTDPGNMAKVYADRDAQGRPTHDVWGNLMPYDDPSVTPSAARTTGAGAAGYTPPGGVQPPSGAASNLQVPSGVTIAPQAAAGKGQGGHDTRDVGGRGAGGGGGTPAPPPNGPPPSAPPPSGPPAAPPPSNRGGGNGYQPRPPGGAPGDPRWTVGGGQGNGQTVPRTPPVVQHNPGDANQAPPPRVVGERTPIIPGPNGLGGDGRPLPLPGWEGYDWGSGGASGNRNAAGAGAFSGYRSLVDNPDVPREIQNDIRMTASKQAAAQYGGAADAINRNAAATGATAGVAAGLSGLARNEAESVMGSDRQAQIALEQERQRRLESGLSGLSGMYNTETGYMGNLTAGRAAAAYKPRVTGGQGASQGTGGSFDFSQILAAL